MAEWDGRHPITPTGVPHTFDHRHSDVSGGWLRAATFGAMDGLVSNTALIAGVAAAASAHTVVISGVAGLLAGAFSMALGEYTSVTTANEQIDSEVRVERRAFERHPKAERAELVAMLVNLGMSHETAATGHRRDPPRREPGGQLPSRPGAGRRPDREAVAVDRGRSRRSSCSRSVPSCRSIPYLLGFESLWAGLICGGVGLMIAGGVAATVHQ